jgi:hypothetical protein
MRPNVKFSNLSALYLHKRQELDRPIQCACLTATEALIGVAVLVYVLGAITGVWLCQTYWR